MPGQGQEQWRGGLAGRQAAGGRVATSNGGVNVVTLMKTINLHHLRQANRIAQRNEFKWLQVASGACCGGTAMLGQGWQGCQGCQAGAGLPLPSLSLSATQSIIY